MKILLLILVLLSTSMCVRANFTISVIDVPTQPGGSFSGQIVGYLHDTRPNPCFGLPSCKIHYFTINKSWLPDGKKDYPTYDRGFLTPMPTSSYPTVHSWWEAVTDKDRVGRDSLPLIEGKKPCMVLAAGIGANMVRGTILSNCAEGIVQAASCSITPNNIMVTAIATVGGSSPTVQVPDVTLFCDSATSVKIETNTGERIPLGGILPRMRSSTGAPDLANPAPYPCPITPRLHYPCGWGLLGSICLGPGNSPAARSSTYRTTNALDLPLAGTTITTPPYPCHRGDGGRNRGVSPTLTGVDCRCRLIFWSTAARLY